MNCVVCNIPLKKLNWKIKVFRCPRCGLGVTERKNIQLGSYHRDKTYIEEESLFRNIFQKRVMKILKFKKMGKVLEVGCSTGLMLSILKGEGWSVKGVEISNESAKVATKRGIDVILGRFEKVGISEKFDLIIFNHTLEHMGNPIKVIEKVLSLLKSKGIIYIDLPNFNSLTANLLGEKWPLLLPNEHLWHFTEQSLRILLERFEFKVIYVEKASGIWDYKNPLGGVLNSFLNFRKRFFVEVLTALPSWVVWKLQQGSDLLMIAKKL